MLPLGDALKRYAPTPKVLPKGVHTELHEVIFKMREQFGEKNKTGVGSFGYYLGRLKNVPLSTIYMWLSEIKQGRDIRNEGKVFWWKYREWRKAKKPVDNNVVEPPKPPTSGENETPTI